MPFTQADFTPENAQRLSVIVCHRMNINPLSSFNSLPPSQRTKYNRILNEYVNSLGDDWYTKLLTDFNNIVNEDILNENFQPSKQYVPQVNTDRTLLLTPEQQEFLESRRIELGDQDIRV